jgi:hypothetical protein
MDIKEGVWEIVDWMHQAEDRNKWRAVVNKTEPSGSINGG